VPLKPVVNRYIRRGKGTQRKAEKKQRTNGPSIRIKEVLRKWIQTNIRASKVKKQRWKQKLYRSVQKSLRIESRKKTEVHPLRKRTVSIEKRKRNMAKKGQRRKCFGTSLSLDFEVKLKKIVGTWLYDVHVLTTFLM
jgi:hypothetical protein